MSGEAHEGIVAFSAETTGRELIMLGRVQVGEILRWPDLRGRHQACFRLTLPEASASGTWRPARDIDEARRLALLKIDDWLQAAGLAPTGAMSIATPARCEASSPGRGHKGGVS